MNIAQIDAASAKEQSKVLAGLELHEKPFYKTVWNIKGYNFAKNVREIAERQMVAGMSLDEAVQKYGNGGQVIEKVVHMNMLLNEGINELLLLLTGGGGVPYNNANTRIGVGDSTTAESAAQTDLQASTNKLYKAMDSGYPQVGSQQMVVRSTFASAEANFAWNEFTIDNGSVAAKNLNRKVSAQGTKIAGQTWQVTVTLTLQ